MIHWFAIFYVLALPLHLCIWGVTHGGCNVNGNMYLLKLAHIWLLFSDIFSGGFVSCWNNIYIYLYIMIFFGWKKTAHPEVGISVFDRLRLQLQKNGCHPYTWVSNPVEQYMIDFYNRASKAMVTHERPLLMAFWTSSWLLKNEVSLLVGAPVYVILQQFDTEQFVLWGPLFGSCMIDFSLTGLELNHLDLWHHPYASVASAHMLCPRGLHDTLANQAKCQPQQKPGPFFWWAVCI